MISNFSLGFSREQFPLPILVGKYRDFDTLWYFDDGAKVVMVMLSNTYGPFIGKLLEPVIAKVLAHILDRCFKKHLKKKTNIEEEKAAAAAAAKGATKPNEAKGDKRKRE